MPFSPAWIIYSFLVPSLHLLPPHLLLYFPCIYILAPSSPHLLPLLPHPHRQSDELDRAPVEWGVVVTLDKEKFPVRATWAENGFTVEIAEEETVVLNTDWMVGEPRMLANIGWKEVTVQVGEGEGGKEVWLF